MQVCVLGDGQLGRMLRQAGEPLGISVWPIGPDARAETIPWRQSVITAEIERWPETALTRELVTHSAFVNRDVFPIIADRLTQKRLFERLNLPTAPWLPLNSGDNWPQIFSQLGEQVVVKRRTGGYDGRGQWRLQFSGASLLPHDCYGASIVEKAICFSGEASLIGARGRGGELIFYPLTLNLHQDGILRASVAHPFPDATLQRQAQELLGRLLTELDYVGVMAMECFITPDGLLINELAPRVHNSGHWTQNGASLSQFELHLRAILDLPLPTPIVDAPTAMINLIGTPKEAAWLRLGRVHLHWYDKEVRPGRKVGHLNIHPGDANSLSATLSALAPLLPEDYADTIAWARKELRQDGAIKMAQNSR